MNFSACGFIGHHPSRFRFGLDEEDEYCKILKMVLLQQIQLLCQKGVSRFYTVCAPGTELWCGELVDELKKQNGQLQLHCIMPYEECTTKWPPYLRERSFKLMETCTCVTLIEHGKSHFSQLKAYLDLVNRSDVLLAVYAPESICGDAADQALLYAIGKGKRIILIHPDTFDTRDLDTSNLDILRFFSEME